jgi:phosphatidylserine decarboxylase
MKAKILGWLLPWIPKNTLSHVTGWLVHLKLPPALAGWSVAWFARRYRINTAEAEFPLTKYPSIGEFFTRRLKEGVRPIAESSVVHPADAVITQSGTIVDGNIIQAKGKNFTVVELLADSALAHLLMGGEYATYYLCPTDYHRVHSPLTGKISYAAHVPGELWPVNEWSVENVEKLFAVNERQVTRIDGDRGTAVVVMVGATNVGSIRMEYDSDWRTNRAGTRYTVKRYQPPLPIVKGQELGVFQMGSTVIVLYQKGLLATSLRPGKTQMGGPAL